MTITDKISIKNVKNIRHLEVEFKFTDSNIIVVTGKNGTGKTTLIEALHLLEDPEIFEKTSSNNAIGPDSEVKIEVQGFSPFEFKFNEKLGVLDSKDALPEIKAITAEQTFPTGERFSRYAQVSTFDSQIRNNIAATEYGRADELISFLTDVYSSNKFKNLQLTTINNKDFYFCYLKTVTIYEKIT